MKKLIEAGLFGQGLIAVENPDLVERYNGALADMGITPTNLKSFNIDGVGWSPEIAKEKNNDWYLSHGESNQFIIILTPDQRGKPVYRPYHSFDRDLMEKIFRNYDRQISTVTARTAIWIDLENDLDTFVGPSDLLLIEGLLAEPHSVGKLMTAAREQRELVGKFKKDNGWADPSIRSQIIESARTNGDMRFKSIIMSPLPFTDLRCYHTCAFGGVFVFRDLDDDSTLLVIEDPELKKSTLLSQKGIMKLQDEKLFGRLEELNLIEVPIAWYQDNILVLDRIKECLVAQTLYADGKDHQMAGLNPALRKKIAVELSSVLPEEYIEIERFAKMLRGTKRNSKQIRISKKLAKILMRPMEGLSAPTARVVWQLIAKMGAVDIERQYTFNKNGFFEDYAKWPEGRQQWAIEFLKTRGELRNS